MLSVNWSGTLQDKRSWLANEILIEIGSNGTNNRSWRHFASWTFVLLTRATFIFAALLRLFSARRGAKGDPVFMGMSDSSWSLGSRSQLDRARQTVDRLSRVLRVRQRSVSRHCSSWTRGRIRIRPSDESMTLFVRTRTAPYVLDICNVNVQLDRGDVYLATTERWEETDERRRRSRGVVRASMQSFLYLSIMAVTSRPDTRARNSRNSNATGKLLSKNLTVEFHWTKCHHRVLTWTRRNGTGDPISGPRSPSNLGHTFARDARRSLSQLRPKFSISSLNSSRKTEFVFYVDIRMQRTRIRRMPLKMYKIIYLIIRTTQMEIEMHR